MNRDTIKEAQAAARLFLAAADAALALREGEVSTNRYHGMGTAASGECRHVSMLLTRALARMRRPG